MQLPLVILKAFGLQEEEGLQPLVLVPMSVVMVWISTGRADVQFLAHPEAVG